MSQLMALALSVGVLGAIDTLLTGTILPIPVWVTFIAWASFFACGGGTSGLVKSVVSNWIGIAIASLSLLAASLVGGVIAAAIFVGIGSACMILATKNPLTNYPPAIVWGFASFVGTMVATKVPVTAVGINHPTLVAAFSMLVGALFGIASELVANALATKPVTA